MDRLNDRTTNAYARALDAARAALDAGTEDAAKAARNALLDVTDPAELQRIAGSLAWLAVYAVPGRVRRGRSVRDALDRVNAELLLRTL